MATEYGLNYGAALIKRHNKLKGEASTHFVECEKMATYIAPSRLGILGARQPGVKQTSELYDSTTLMAAELLSQFIAGHIINPSQRWSGFQMKDPSIRNIDIVKEYMDECRDRFLEACGASAFYAEGPEALIDYTGFGTACMFGEEAPQPSNRVLKGFRGFHFRAERTGRFLIQEGANGRVDTVFREMQMTTQVIAERWDKDGYAYSFPESITNAIKEKQWDKTFKIIHAVIPRAVEDQNVPGAKGMPWSSCWIEEASKHIIYEGGYRVFPAAIPRYSKTPGEIFGRGRGHIAFPDTWSLNSAKRMSLEDFALKIRPPVLHAHNSNIGSLRLVPGGPTAVNTHGKAIKDVIMPYETGSHPEITQINEENLRKSIRDIFYVDAILQMLEAHKSEMTAFEFARKLELLFRLLGPVYGRIEWEWLYSIVDLGFAIMQDAGAFSPPPAEVLMSDGQINIVFDNPIARAQRSGDSEALLMAVNDLGPLVQVRQDPAMLDWIDDDETVQGVLATRGVPAKWTRSAKEVSAIREARRQQQEKEQQVQQAQELAKAAKDAAPLMKQMQGQQ